MLYTIPDYYKEFQCTASECEDTCCAGWQIVIDEKSKKKYKKVRGHFRGRMLRSVNWKEGVFRQDKEKRCAFLNEKNLCDMYVALGEKSLCRTCRLYPRHIEEFEGVREISLSLSCPEVTKILLSKKEPVKFLNYEKDGEEEYEDFDLFLYSKLADAREVMFKILQDRSKSIAVRAGLCLGIAHDMQGRIQRGELFACDEVLEKYQTEAAETFLNEKYQKWQQDQAAAYLFAEENMMKLYDLELLKENWYVTLKETEAQLYPYGTEKVEMEQAVEEYFKISENFDAWKKENMAEWDVMCEQLLVYFIFTYFCGAVYDARVYAKTQMAAYSVFVIGEILKGRWLMNEETLDQEDVIDVVYRYSRELEHSDENLERLEKMMEQDVWI